MQKAVRKGGVVSEQAKLVGRAKKGDVGAYEKLVRGHQTVAFRTAYLISYDVSEAEDATQEAFVKAYRSLKKFRDGAAFRPWLLTIVANEAKNRRKAAGKRAGLNLRSANEAPQDLTSPSPEATVLATEERTELLRAVEGLREEERLVVSCRYFLELSEKETAAVLDCPKGTVKSRLSRAVGRLRETMAKEKDGG